MVIGATGAARHHLLDPGDAVLRATGDGDLMHRFVARRDEAAFGELLRRHGPLVWGVCRRVLGRAPDAEDAFQTAFLLLARNAAAVRDGASAASWLYGTAYRVAVRLRHQARQRRQREARAAPPPETTVVAEASLREVQAILDDEVSRLPEKLRAPFVLCCLDGKGRAEAARALGCNEGTLSSRLAAARERLRARLTRRGVLLSAALAAAALADGAGAAVPAGLMAATLAAALRGGAPALGRLALAVALLVATVVVGGTGAVLCGAGPETAAAQEPPPPAAPARPAPPTVDRYGDALPPGAVARLGSLRLNHGTSVEHLVVSGDGTWALSSSTGPNPHRRWDLATGRALPLNDVPPRFAYLAAGSRLWAVDVPPGPPIRWVLRDVATDRETLSLPLTGTSFGRPALSPDGKTFVAWTADFRGGKAQPLVTFADVTGKAPPRNVDLRPGTTIFTHDFSADGKTLATFHDDGTADVWDVTAATVRWHLPAAARAVGHVALSPDGATLALRRSAENFVHLYDVATKKERFSLDVPRPRSFGFRSLAFSPDGTLFAAADEAGLRLYDLATKRELRRLAGTSRVEAPTFTADGKRLVAADGPHIGVWDVATGQRLHDFGHTYAVDAAAFAPDGKTLVSGAAYTDTVVRVWDPRTGEPRGRWAGHGSGIEEVVYAPDGALVASASQDGTVRLWDAATGRPLRTLDAKDGMVYGMAFTPDGKALATGGKRKAVHLWDVATGQETRAFDNPGSWITKLVFSGDGRLVATRGLGEAFVRVWDVAAGKELKRLETPKTGWSSLAFVPGGSVLVSSADDGSVRLYDANAGTEQAALGPATGRCLSVGVAPDGRTVAAGYEDGSVRLWELASRRERIRFVGHTSAALRVTFSPDGSLLASGSSDQTLLVWDVDGRSFAPGRAERNAAALQTLWDDLKGDASKAHAAMRRLRDSGSAAVAAIRAHLRPTPEADAEQVARLIADLDADDFATRTRADRALADLGESAEPLLRRSLAGQPSAELRRRAEALLARLQPENSPETLRAVRAVEVLERVGDAEARALLTQLARGAVGSRRTREAKEALRRLSP